MVHITITGYAEPEQKIRFIKALREVSVATLGLKQAKVMADALFDSGLAQELVVKDTAACDEYGIEYFVKASAPPVLDHLRVVQNFLYEAPRNITIQEAFEMLSVFKTGA